MGQNKNLEKQIIEKTVSGKIKTNATSFRDYIFKDCNSLTEIDAPECTRIGSYAISGCNNLTSISLPRCEVFGDNCFSNIDNSLLEIYLPSIASYADIGDYYNNYAKAKFTNSTISVYFPNLEAIGGGTGGTDNLYIFSNFNGTAYFPELKWFRSSNSGSTYRSAGIFNGGNGSTFHFGNKLTDIGYGFTYQSSNNVKIYLHYEENDPVEFNVEHLVNVKGSSKNTYTYNYYTNNSTIRNACIGKADQYTIVNVYHLDGSAW